MNEAPSRLPQYNSQSRAPVCIAKLFSGKLNIFTDAQTACIDMLFVGATMADLQVEVVFVWAPSDWHCTNLTFKELELSPHWWPPLPSTSTLTFCPDEQLCPDDRKSTVRFPPGLNIHTDTNWGAEVRGSNLHVRRPAGCVWTPATCRHEIISLRCSEPRFHLWPWVYISSKYKFPLMLRSPWPPLTSARTKNILVIVYVMRTWFCTRQGGEAKSKCIYYVPTTWRQRTHTFTQFTQWVFAVVIFIFSYSHSKFLACFLTLPPPVNCKDYSDSIHLLWMHTHINCVCVCARASPYKHLFFLLCV